MLSKILQTMMTLECWEAVRTVHRGGISEGFERYTIDSDDRLLLQRNEWARKRQVICDLSKANITLQAGAMQWMAGNVNATTGLQRGR